MPICVHNLELGSSKQLVVMSGPCVIESETHCLRAAETLKKMFSKHNVGLIFKSSYDKANRSSGDSFRGPGLHEGVRILQKVQKELQLPVVTDVHTVEEARVVGEVCEIVQIPAFLCRQTDLVLAAAQTGAVVSVKKGQFLAPWDMQNVVEKIASTENRKIVLVERGVTFGYNNLVVDMRSIPWMQKMGYPVCFDATHAVQKPGGLGKMSGGDREEIPCLAKAALAAGADLLFIESHDHPSQAKSDAATVMAFSDLDRWLPIFRDLYLLLRSSHVQ